MKMGHLLKLIRTSKGYSQKEMADLLGISQNYLSLIESNKKKPSEDKMLEFAERLNISKDALMLISLEVPDELSENEKNNFKKLQKNILSLILFESTNNLLNDAEGI